MPNTASDNSALPVPPWRPGSLIRLFVQIVFGIWLCALTLFFLMRFSFAFYFEHSDAIRALLGLQ